MLCPATSTWRNATAAILSAAFGPWNGGKYWGNAIPNGFDQWGTHSCVPGQRHARMRTPRENGFDAMALGGRDYVAAVRHPWAAALFVLPLLAVYEAGVLAQGNSAPGEQ